MKGKLYLEDGSLYEGTAFGAQKTAVGELVFNTSMTGYQEILTDPSYQGQVIVMTYPMIGNYGIEAEQNQSDKIRAFGLIVHQLCETPSGHGNSLTLNDWLCAMEVPAISGVDTRKLTKALREKGTVKCVITTEDISVEEMKRLCENNQLKEDYMKEASWLQKEDLASAPGEWNVALLDFGIKRSILKEMEKRGCRFSVFPYGFTAEEVIESNPDGIFLSNGPGDPAKAAEAVQEVKKLLEARNEQGEFFPIFGICMGHQILALAAGGRTYKLKYGHRGGNHGVYNKKEDKSYITAQNHGYGVEEGSLIVNRMEVTEINLNDGTVEAMRHSAR